jgi:hypothetical protein
MASSSADSSWDIVTEAGVDLPECGPGYMASSSADSSWDIVTEAGVDLPVCELCGKHEEDLIPMRPDPDDYMLHSPGRDQATAFTVASLSGDELVSHQHTGVFRLSDVRRLLLEIYDIHLARGIRFVHSIDGCLEERHGALLESVPGTGVATLALDRPDKGPADRVIVCSKSSDRVTIVCRQCWALCTAA